MHTGEGCGFWNEADLSFNLESLGLEALRGLDFAHLVASIPDICSLPPWASWSLTMPQSVSLLEFLHCKFSCGWNGLLSDLHVVGISFFSYILISGIYPTHHLNSLTTASTFFLPKVATS